MKHGEQMSLNHQYSAVIVSNLNRPEAALKQDQWSVLWYPGTTGLLIHIAGTEAL